MTIVIVIILVLSNSSIIFGLILVLFMHVAKGQQDFFFIGLFLDNKWISFAVCLFSNRSQMMPVTAPMPVTTFFISL